MPDVPPDAEVPDLVAYVLLIKPGGTFMDMSADVLIDRFSDLPAAIKGLEGKF